jgi:hypothetical protein
LSEKNIRVIVDRSVFWIRIHVFLGLQDPDPLVRAMDPDPDLDPNLLSASKNSKKNLDFYCFVASLGLIFEK